MERNCISYHFSEDSQVLTVTINKNYLRKVPWSKQLLDLSVYPKLKDLRIENEGTTSIEDFEGVFQAVEHSSVTQVSFEDQELEPKIVPFQTKDIDDFETNTTVTYLSLENLDDHCIRLIASSLRRNKTLQSLTIKDNYKKLTKQTLRRLDVALENNWSLVHLNLPSHFCMESDYKSAMRHIADTKKKIQIRQLTTECEQFKQEIEELKQAKHLLSDANEQLQNGNRRLERAAFTARAKLTSLLQEYNKQDQAMRLLQEEVRTLREQHAVLAVDIPHYEITLGELVGAGGYGVVYKAQWHGQNVAVKGVKVEDIETGKIDSLIHEARTVMRLHHKHVVLSMGTTMKPDTSEIMLVMEYLKHGSLQDLLFKHRVKLERPQVIQLALDIAKGLNYLHCLTPKIIHRDLKCANILLYNSRSRAKISDFGTARFLNQNSVAKTFQGTFGYFAPELVEEEYDEKADVYSFGMVLLVLATSNSNLPTTRDPSKLRNKIDEILNTSSSMNNDEQFRKLVHDCCQISSTERPSMKQCIEVLKALRQKHANNN